MAASAAGPTAALMMAAVVTPWLRPTVRLSREQEMVTAVTVTVKTRKVRWLHEFFGGGLEILAPAWVVCCIGG